MIPDTFPRRDLWTRILILLGMRSECCGARTYQPNGWARKYCSKCDRRVS